LAGSENNELKYVQNPMAANEDSTKQEQPLELDKLKDQADFSDVKKMTEQEGMYAGAGGGDGTQSNDAAETAAAAALLSGAAQSADPSSSPLAGGAAESAALSSQSPLSSESSSEPSIAETSSAFNGGSEASSSETGDVEGIAKSLSKASSMTTDAVMDMLKSGKVPGTDFSNADVSAGPDPYDTNGAASDESLSSLLGGSKGGSPSEDTAGSLESAASDLTGGLGGSLSSDSGLSTSDQSLGSEDLSSRSVESSEQQSDEDYERNIIPLEEHNAYRTRYNTEIFKKHVIMRPKRDTYVSPFDSKEAFDTAI